MANVLVTGGAGYVGSVCCAELLRAGHSVVVVDDLSTGFRQAVPPGAPLCESDIADSRAMRFLFSENKFDAVFHFAAKALGFSSSRMWPAESVSSKRCVPRESRNSCFLLLPLFMARPKPFQSAKSIQRSQPTLMVKPS